MSKPRILVTGAGGQLGCALVRVLRPVAEVLTVVRAGSTGASGTIVADLADPVQTSRLVRELRPQVIVNAAAYTAVDAAESDVDAATKLNAQLPGVLAEEARALGALLIHYSTDYVFAGDGTEPWRETDPCQPLNVYGATKLAGERAIEGADAMHVILRTSWLYGIEGRNFVKTMLGLAEREQIKVVADQVGSPTSARWLAATTAEIIQRLLTDPADRRASYRGTYHAVCRGETSWHGLATAIFQQAQAMRLVKRVPQVLAVSSAEYAAAARRPQNSRLDTTKLSRTFGIEPPSWDLELAALLPEIAAACRRSSTA